jgi:hypothetical protein
MIHHLQALLRLLLPGRFSLRLKIHAEKQSAADHGFLAGFDFVGLRKAQ